MKVILVDGGSLSDGWRRGQTVLHHKRKVCFLGFKDRSASRSAVTPRPRAAATSGRPRWDLRLGFYTLVYKVQDDSELQETEAPRGLSERPVRISCVPVVSEVRDLSSWSAIAVILLPAAPLGNETSCPTVWLEGVNPHSSSVQGLSCHQPPTV